MKMAAISKPGTMAAKNNAPTETCACTAYATSTILGGMIGLRSADAAVIPALNR
jgi:hypothetical protein